VVGAVISVGVIALAAVVDRPAGRRLERVVAGCEGRSATAEETADIRRLSERSILVGRLATVMLLVALATMAIARYS
jgi:hypothetical protein